jgi:hypothetical protein
MHDRGEQMLAYIKLAGLSQSRRQLGPRDKFLVLAAAAAHRSGWPAVAERCRELVLSNNPAHLLRRWPTYDQAAADADFAPFLKQLMRFCPLERAEHLLAQLEITAALPPLQSQLSAGDYALLLLGRSEPPGAAAP